MRGLADKPNLTHAIETTGLTEGLDIGDAPVGTVAALCAAAAAAGLAGGLGLTLVIRHLAHRLQLDVRGRTSWRSPAVALCVAVAVRAPLAAADAQRDWAADVVGLLDLALIVIVGWWLVDLALILEQVALTQRPVTGADDRQARHARTKITLLRRMVTALVVTVVLGALLWSIPAVREIGIGILASAGVIGIVAGLAAQTSLSNLFAGVQIAFTDGIRIDDIVVIEDEWGRIEEITLTYVVVRLWDSTCIILPSTYFITNPFRNWTHRDAASMGVVELSVDWRVPLDDLRQELARALGASEHWDGRRGELLVEDATGAYLTLAAIVTAVDGDTLATLRWEVREAMVTYLQRHHPDALPREGGDDKAPAPAPTRGKAAPPELPDLGF